MDNSPTKSANKKFDLEEESPKKFSKFYTKNDSDGFSGTIRNKSISGSADLRKYALINTMKDKMQGNENGVDLEVPEENSPIKNTIKQYESFALKSKNN